MDHRPPGQGQGGQQQPLVRPLPSPGPPRHHPPNNLQSPPLSQPSSQYQVDARRTTQYDVNSYIGPPTGSGSSRSTGYGTSSLNSNSNSRGGHARESSAPASSSSSSHLPPRSRSPLPPVPSPSLPFHSLPTAPPRSPSSTSPLPPGTSCISTKDHESFHLIDLSLLRSPAAIRESIFSKLQIEDDAFSSCEIYRTKMKAGKPLGGKLRDDELWEICKGDDEAVFSVRVGGIGMGSLGGGGADGLVSGSATEFSMRRESSSSARGGEERSPTHYHPPPHHSQSLPPPPNYPEIQPPSSYAPSSHSQSHSRRHPSISSHSDVSNPNHISPVRESSPGGLGLGAVGEFGEPRGGGVGVGQGWNWGSGGSSQSQNQGGSGQRHSAEGLSPPMDRREWSSTSGGEDYSSNRGGGGYPSPQPSSQSQSLKHQPSSHAIIMLPSGPVRRLPAPSDTLSRPPPSPSPLPPNPSTSTSTSSANIWTTSHAPLPPPSLPSSSGTIRPLPQTNTFGPYHNLHVQGLQSTFHSNQPTPPLPPPPLIIPPHQSSTLQPHRNGSGSGMGVTKSANNLRDHYLHAFESDLRPSLTPQYPPSSSTLRNPNSNYPTSPPPPSRPQPPRLPPPSQSSSSLQLQRAPQPPLPPNPTPFDPRVMRPSISSQSSSSSSQIPPIPQRPVTSAGTYHPHPHPHSQSHSQWPNSPPLPLPTPPPTRRSPSDSHTPYAIPPPPPSSSSSNRRSPSENVVVGSIPLLPGQILQQQIALQGRRVSGERDGREGERTLRSSGGGGRVEDVSRVLQPAGGGNRDSGSSSSSSSVSGWRNQLSSTTTTTTNSVPSAPPPEFDEEDLYGGLEGSPPTSSASARSSTSTSNGPITPSDGKNLVPSGAGVGVEGVEGYGDEEDTLQANEWKKVVANVFSADDSEGGSGSGRTPTPSSSMAMSRREEEEEEEEDEESGTFVKGYGPARIVPSSSTVETPRSRPTLHVETTASPSPSPSRPPPPLTQQQPLQQTSPRHSTSSSSPRHSPTHSASTTKLPRSTRTSELSQLSTTPSPLARSGSFLDRARKETDWAPRPKIEDVLENLEVFFPKHDLEKEVFETEVGTPVTAASPSLSPGLGGGVSGGAGLGMGGGERGVRDVMERGRGGGEKEGVGLMYKKSIKIVARDRKRNMLKASARAQQHAVLVGGEGARMGVSTTSVMRRKSTKLFGSRVEEVTPAQIKTMDEVQERGEDDPANFSFKWIKGEMIGRGSYGKVYIAFNVTAGEAIAVKQVELPRTASDKEDTRLQGMVTSLKAEIELLKDLSHENIVEYLGMEETTDYLSIFLEYVPGGSVGRIIRTHGKFPEDVIKDFTFQILGGLKYLHNLGILHRDLKGDNILCDHDGICKISDFGTSKKSQDIYNNNVDMSMQGSIFWMAPEVIRNERKGYSAKADIWSVGCLVLEMFAGRRPWDQNEMMQTMFKLGQDRLAPPVPDDVILSDLAKAFFKDCFQPNPDDRPQAQQLMRHYFLALPADYAFSNTTLYHAIASARSAPAPKAFESPE